MFRYSRIKEQNKEVKCLGPGWLSSNLVRFHGSGTDSALWRGFMGQEFSEQGPDPLCFEIQAIRTEAVPHPVPSWLIL